MAKRINDALPEVMNTRGFIALMSVIVISAILLALTFTLGTAAFLNRFDTLAWEQKRASLVLAEACVNAAMLRHAQRNYSGGIVSVGERSCAICSITSAGEIRTRASVGNTHSNLFVRISPSTYAVTLWRETPLAPAGCALP